MSGIFSLTLQSLTCFFVTFTRTFWLLFLFGFILDFAEDLYSFRFGIIVLGIYVALTSVLVFNLKEVSYLLILQTRP
jgi:hypothetical protein